MYKQRTKQSYATQIFIDFFILAFLYSLINVEHLIMYPLYYLSETERFSLKTFLVKLLITSEICLEAITTHRFFIKNNKPKMLGTTGLIFINTLCFISFLLFFLNVKSLCLKQLLFTAVIGTINV